MEKINVKIFTVDDEVPNLPGSYFLLFELNQSIMVNVGKIKDVTFQKGFYGYAGTAFGSGGLRARIKRHLIQNKKKKWHLDWIRPYLSFIQGWYVVNMNLECIWSQTFLNGDDCFLPLKKMGASDCKLGCPAHFFGFISACPNDRIEKKIHELSSSLNISGYFGF